MPEQIPITPEVLKWARQRAGLTVEDAEEHFGNFADWEQGLSFPTYPQLEKLADTLKIPVAVFFFPQPPPVPPITETFRTLPTSEIDRLPARIRMLLRKAKSMQLNLHELTDGRNPAARLITHDLTFASQVNIVDMAAAVRAYIGISVDEQQRWNDHDIALKEWRDALQRVGVFVFKDAFKVDEYSGFCLYDEVFPIVYVNNSSAKTRQIFTYFHELAHLLFHTSGIDTVHDSFISSLNIDAQTIEMICNRFASEFLLPDELFVRLSANHAPSEATAELFAAQFHVSREVIFRRFLDHGRINQQTYSSVVSQWNQQRQSGGEGAGGNFYWTKLAYLGRDYVSLALSKFHQNRIDENQLAEYLDTKPKNVGVLEEYFQRGNV